MLIFLSRQRAPSVDRSVHEPAPAAPGRPAPPFGEAAEPDVPDTHATARALEAAAMPEPHAGTTELPGEESAEASREPADSLTIAALARGDRRAFDAVYEQHRAPLYTFLLRLSGRAALAEDLLQETWLRLVHHAAALPPGTQLRPWLFTVARNLHTSHRRWALLDGSRLLDLAFQPRGSSPSPLEAMAATEAQRALERALTRLPLADREALLLCVVSGFEPSEAASILNISAEATRQRLARARAKLKVLLRSNEASDEP
ncbi:MAG TPA: RNA polymerase sigma factor [Polyangiaceae bacterium]|nr:RNA polymerase sigma factor [Polyangiaceae bacterium]